MYTTVMTGAKCNHLEYRLICDIIKEYQGRIQDFWKGGGGPS